MAAERTPDAGARKVTAAGLYDHYLGGSNNTPEEREAAARIRAVFPELEGTVWANRSFHQRAARWITQQGVRQFIDLGAGLPTQDNTHQIVQRVAPETRVLYVDYDPRTVELGGELMAGEPNTTFVLADARNVDDVLGAPECRELIDLSQPVGVLATAVLHFVSDDEDPIAMVAKYMEQLAPGSYLVLSHITADRQPRERIKTFLDIYRSAGEMGYFRSREQIEALFDGLELVPPYAGSEGKLTYIGVWGADDPVEADDDDGRFGYVGVARKP
ncbi:MAG: hypothetical protein GEV07_15285 [Streptosporangiales bacterium]|nr:hypothetical protein [Streptosporangiales bacterium]